MEIVANGWFVWLLLLVAAFVNKRFTVHEIRTGVRVSVVRWYLTLGFFWGSASLFIFSILLNAIKFAKG